MSDSDELRGELQRALSPRYQVGEEIGRGGTAYVYRGWDTLERRAVAFKVLTHEYAALLGTRRFLREIKFHLRLNHPGILPVLDSGEVGHLCYFIMPLAQGETLEARLKREPQLPLDTVRRILTQVAAALDYAHDHGIIHRDVKPSNLFLCGDEALLADFGIAKDLVPATGESTTSTGMAVGTAYYMSPEQWDASPHTDRRADVYSLGCVTYQMLTGELPFSGPSTDVVRNRHCSTPMPSIRLIRPDLPKGVQPVVRKALAKSPADRYQRAGDFATALTDPTQLRAAAAEERAEEQPVRRWVRPLGVALAALGMLLVAFWPSARPLDGNKVVVFPLSETPVQATQQDAGIVVALMIGSALEYTDPLEWIDGLWLVDSKARDDASLLTAGEARRLARKQGARWYLDGTVVRQGDSATVVIRLNDASGDSVIGRASATRVATEAPQAGLAAISQLLPKLLAPGRDAGELSALIERKPAAVAHWLQGELAYRRSNFTQALDYEQRAVAEDSSLAVAALRGAEAASWLFDIPVATALADVAMRRLPLLPVRMAEFARGLDAYLGGQADSAVYWLTRALERSPKWAEAHMALGETYYHLLPAMPGSPDSMAEIEFSAAAVDTGFSEPRLHLAEIMIRQGDPKRAKREVEEFIRLAPDAHDKRAQLTAMLACAQSGRRSMDWNEAARAAPLPTLSAAKLLSVAGAFPGCSEDGFRAVFQNPAAFIGDRWGAFLGLQGILAAEGRVTELRAIVDSARTAGLFLADQLYLLDALAGVGVEAEGAAADERLRRGGAETDKETYPFTLWLLGEWHARRGDAARTDSLRRVLTTMATRSGDSQTRRFADALGARLLLLKGDTTAAIGQLHRLLGLGRQWMLDWDLGESLAADRLLLAELLLAHGQAREAMAAAAIFDHPAPAAFLPYLPASLTLRRRAALLLNDERAARRFEQRLEALGRRSEVARGSSPSSKQEAS